jgi:sec-independent protein translocase protein TatA
MLSTIFLFFSFSGSEIMFILFVALILFGGDKFPEIARGLGKGIREFKDMSDGVKREIHTQINSYENNPNRDNEVSTPVAPPYDPVSDVTPVHQTPEVTPPIEPAADAVAPAPEVHQVAQLPAMDLAHESVPKASKDAEVVGKKPDLTPPPNTISHQSY